MKRTLNIEAIRDMSSKGLALLSKCCEPVPREQHKERTHQPVGLFWDWNQKVASWITPAQTYVQQQAARQANRARHIWVDLLQDVTQFLAISLINAFPSKDIFPS